VTYRTVGERTKPYTEANPWVVPLRGVDARFVRIRVEGAGALILSELEVYGR